MRSPAEWGDEEGENAGYEATYGQGQVGKCRHPGHGTGNFMQVLALELLVPAAAGSPVVVVIVLITFIDAPRLAK